nr:hypothetical protein Iba_chr15eCG0400 [Ipomoea batatas]
MWLYRTMFWCIYMRSFFFFFFFFFWRRIVKTFRLAQPPPRHLRCSSRRVSSPLAAKGFRSPVVAAIAPVSSCRRSPLPPIIKNEDLEELKEIGLWNIWHCLSWQMKRNRCCHQENKEKLLHWPIIRAREAGSGLNTLVKMKELQVIR